MLPPKQGEPISQGSVSGLSFTIGSVDGKPKSLAIRARLSEHNLSRPEFHLRVAYPAPTMREWMASEDPKNLCVCPVGAYEICLPTKL